MQNTSYPAYRNSKRRRYGANQNRRIRGMRRAQRKLGTRKNFHWYWSSWDEWLREAS
jgi:hypothetical protein